MAASDNPTPATSVPVLTRRRLLGSAARLSAAAAAAALMPPNVRRLLAAEAETPPRGSFADIKHIVMLMQENRSFDHYFGTLAGPVRLVRVVRSRS